MICTRPSCGLEIPPGQERRERIYLVVSSRTLVSKRMHDVCASTWEAEKTGVRSATPEEVRTLLSPASARIRMMADNRLIGNRRRTKRLVHDFRRKAHVQ